MGDQAMLYSFLADFIVNDTVVFQLLHGANFPEFSESVDDKGFGIALYVLTGHIPNDKEGLFKKFVKDEPEVTGTPVQKQEYYAFDLNMNIRLGFYSIETESDFSVELTNEGALQF